MTQADLQQVHNMLALGYDTLRAAYEAMHVDTAALAELRESELAHLAWLHAHAQAVLVAYALGGKE